MLVNNGLIDSDIDFSHVILFFECYEVFVPQWIWFIVNFSVMTVAK